MAQDPTISPKRPQVSHPQPALQSTPQAKGSATISEHIASTVGVQVSEIRPWITRDIEKSAKCSIDEMLKDLLADCTDKSQESLDDAFKTSLFEKCLEGVLPICNGEPIPTKDLNAKSYQVREILDAYSTTQVGAEKELYPLFVKAANTALFFLDELDMEHIRPANKSAVCFHVHDPALLTQIHQCLVSQCKPDVIVVSDSEPDIRDAHGFAGDIHSREDFFPRAPTQVPMKLFERRSLRAFLGFEKSINESGFPPTSHSSRKDTLHHEDDYLRMDVVSESGLDAHWTAGVPNDFDLTSTQDIATGTDRTGTVPFMAVALLEDEALLGAIRHTYEHEAESFIWSLLWITLRYDGGKLRKLTRGRPLDKWLTVGAAQCRKAKHDFLIFFTRVRRSLEAGIGHEENWKSAQQCIIALMNRIFQVTSSMESLPSLDADTAFTTLLKAPIATSPYLLPGL